MKEHKIVELGIGRKFQAPSVFNGITIQENMELAAAKKHTIYSTTFRKLPKEKLEYITYILEFTGLVDKKIYVSNKIIPWRKAMA